MGSSYARGFFFFAVESQLRTLLDEAGTQRRGTRTAAENRAGLRDATKKAWVSSSRMVRLVNLVKNHRMTETWQDPGLYGLQVSIGYSN